VVKHVIIDAPKGGFDPCPPLFTYVPKYRVHVRFILEINSTHVSFISSEWLVINWICAISVFHPAVFHLEDLITTSGTWILLIEILLMFARTGIKWKMLSKTGERRMPYLC